MRVPHGSALWKCHMGCPIMVLHEGATEECHMRVPHESVPWECHMGGCHMRVPHEECHMRVRHESAM